MCNRGIGVRSPSFRCRERGAISDVPDIRWVHRYVDANAKHCRGDFKYRIGITPKVNGYTGNCIPRWLIQDLAPGQEPGDLIRKRERGRYNFCCRRFLLRPRFICAMHNGYRLIGNPRLRNRFHRRPGPRFISTFGHRMRLQRAPGAVLIGPNNQLMRRWIGINLDARSNGAVCRHQ